MRELDHNDKGKVLPTRRNVMLGLTKSSQWQGVLGYDEFSNKVMLRKDAPPRSQFIRPLLKRGRTLLLLVIFDHGGRRCSDRHLFYLPRLNRFLRSHHRISCNLSLPFGAPFPLASADECDLEAAGSVVNALHSFYFPKKIIYYFFQRTIFTAQLPCHQSAARMPVHHLQSRRMPVPVLADIDLCHRN